jgi:hypothetical protein
MDAVDGMREIENNYKNVKKREKYEKLWLMDSG